MPKKLIFFIERSLKIDNHMWANGVKSVGKNMAHSSDSPPTQLYPVYAPEDYKKKILKRLGNTESNQTGSNQIISTSINKNMFSYIIHIK